MENAGIPENTVVVILQGALEPISTPNRLRSSDITIWRHQASACPRWQGTTSNCGRLDIGWTRYHVEQVMGDTGWSWVW